MKVGQVGSGETADTRLGSTQRKSIRMAVAVECLQEGPVSAGLRTVALGLKGSRASGRERAAIPPPEKSGSRGYRRPGQGWLADRLAST